MPANTNPLYSLTPNVGQCVLTPSINANTKSDGAGTIGTDLVKSSTVAGSNGSYLSSIRVYAYASVAATNTVATVLRIFLSSVTSGATTSANTSLLMEVSLGIQQADHSLSSLNPYEWAVNKAIPAGWVILVSQHIVAATNTGYHFTIWMGDY